MDPHNYDEFKKTLQTSPRPSMSAEHTQVATKLLQRRAKLLAADLHTQLHILRPIVTAPLSCHIPMLARMNDELSVPGCGRCGYSQEKTLSDLRAELRHVKKDSCDSSRFVQARVHNVLDAFEDVSSATNPNPGAKLVLPPDEVAQFSRSLEALGRVRATRDMLRRALDVDHVCSRGCRLLRKAREEAGIELRVAERDADERRAQRLPCAGRGVSGVTAAHDALREWTTCLWDRPEALRVVRSAMAELRSMRPAVYNAPSSARGGGLAHAAVANPAAVQHSCRTKAGGMVRGLVKSASRKRLSKGRASGSSKK